MINVLLLIESLAHRGGTETQLFELFARVDRERFRIHAGCFDGNAPAVEVPQPHHFRVFPMEKVYSAAGLRQIACIRRYIRSRKIDIVETFQYKASYIGVLAAWLASCPVVISSRRDLEDAFVRHPRVAGILNGRTTRILANAEAVKAKVVESEGVAPGKVDVLYNGVDMARFQAEAGADDGAWARLGIPGGAAVVALVGNLRPVKDIPLFLQAAKVVADAVPSAVFLIIGKGDLQPQLEEMATRLGIRDKVFFAGGVDRVDTYLRQAQVGCLSSVKEGFSNAILEYMAAGLPVVATPVGGNPEAVVHGSTGYLVKERSAAEFGGYIVNILRDEEKRRAMGRRGYQRCLELFSIDDAVRRREQYWEQLLNRAQETPAA